MKVLFVLKNSRDTASSRVRGFYISDELCERAIRCRTVYGHGLKKDVDFLARSLRYDIVYFQKRRSRSDIRLNHLARSLGKKTVFDMDDAPAGPNCSSEKELRAAHMMRDCSAVIVGSNELLSFSKRFNESSYLIPSSVNLKYYRPARKRETSKITLGWIGNGKGYKRDLLMLLNPLRHLGKKYRIKLIIIGALEQREIYEGFSKLRNIEIELIDSIDWSDPFAAPAAIARFDIGLYPLLDNDYNRYKCGFKGLEYMAMELPVIASPVGENRFIVEDGKDGFLPSTEEEWKEKLSFLIENERRRRIMGKSGRAKVERSYSTQVSATKLISVFEDLL